MSSQATVVWQTPSKIERIANFVVLFLILSPMALINCFEIFGNNFKIEYQEWYLAIKSFISVKIDRK